MQQLFKTTYYVNRELEGPLTEDQSKDWKHKERRKSCQLTHRELLFTNLKDALAFNIVE